MYTNTEFSGPKAFLDDFEVVDKKGADKQILQVQIHKFGGEHSPELATKDENKITCIDNSFERQF